MFPLFMLDFWNQGNNFCCILDKWIKCKQFLSSIRLCNINYYIFLPKYLKWNNTLCSKYCRMHCCDISIFFELASCFFGFKPLYMQKKINVMVTFRLAFTKIIFKQIYRYTQNTSKKQHILWKPFHCFKKYVLNSLCYTGCICVIFPRCIMSNTSRFWWN